MNAKRPDITTITPGDRFAMAAVGRVLKRFALAS